MVCAQALRNRHGAANRLARPGGSCGVCSAARPHDLLLQAQRAARRQHHRTAHLRVDHHLRPHDPWRLALALGRKGMSLGLTIAALMAAAPVEKALTAKGPLAPLAGTLLDAGKGSPVVLIIPGSGPTD